MLPKHIVIEVDDPCLTHDKNLSAAVSHMKRRHGKNESPTGVEMIFKLSLYSKEWIVDIIASIEWLRRRSGEYVVLKCLHPTMQRVGVNSGKAKSRRSYNLPKSAPKAPLKMAQASRLSVKKTSLTVGHEG